jgi:hypothetical protein
MVAVAAVVAVGATVDVGAIFVVLCPDEHPANASAVSKHREHTHMVARR